MDFETYRATVDYNRNKYYRELLNKLAVTTGEEHQQVQEELDDFLRINTFSSSWAAYERDYLNWQHSENNRQEMREDLKGRLKGPSYSVRSNLSVVSDIDKKAMIDKTLDTIATPEITKEQWIEYLKDIGLHVDE